MNTKQSVAISGVVAAIVAIALIVSSAYIPAIGIGPQSGTLSVMLTDPPTVPTGVTALYINYNNVQVHVSDAGNQSGWTALSGSGQLNLMSLVDVSQTIATANINSGTFNAIRFNITSATVTYNGQNYTADLVYQEHVLTIPISGGIKVSEAETSTALIDLTPTVLLLGTPQNPVFAMIPAARGYVVPTQSVPAEAHHIGQRHNLAADSWWSVALRESAFGVTSVATTPTSLSITVENSGNASVVFRLSAVTTGTSVSGGWQSRLSTSDVFVVEPNETLAVLGGSTRTQMYQEIAAGGYLLAPGQSATFTYSGPIVIGQQLVDLGGQIQTQFVIPGQNYVVSLTGNGMVAQAGTTAVSSIG
ncbi:MAG: DUF4382 domain-containing protein [Nitrososphaerales archaeon]